MKSIWASVLVVAAGAACDGNMDGDPTKEPVGATTQKLSGTAFEGDDGDLVAGTGATDWDSAPSLATKTDKPSGSGDNAFGQGTKEDGATTKVVNGSVPPQKSDLTRFYVSHENSGGKFFLYLAWERTNSLGSANMDFEFNQLAQTLTDASVGTVVLQRSENDILITYDFSGGGAPSLGLLRWLTPIAGNSAAQCFSANSLPCWGKRVDLSASGYAAGAVNAGTVSDPVLDPTIQLGQNQFGEAVINLTDADVFPTGQCVNFASAFLKSRSSSSFTAEVKDFIAPGTANISNCGSIGIHKTDGTNALAGAGFTLYAGSPTGTTCSGTAVGTCTTAADGNCSFGGTIPFGTYCIAETTTPANYFTAAAQTVTISADISSATLNFVNVPQPGALLITKTSSANGAALAGAKFSISKGGTVVATGVSDALGQVCVTGLEIGSTYTVTETEAPANYAIDDPSKDVAVTVYSPDCATAPATVGFKDSPLSDISCSFNSDTGLTAATIQCTGETESSSFITHSMNNLLPGSYSCTFVISNN